MVVVARKRGVVGSHRSDLGAGSGDWRLPNREDAAPISIRRDA
jgi:hypothetical protein